MSVIESAMPSGYRIHLNEDVHNANSNFDKNVERKPDQYVQRTSTTGKKHELIISVEWNLFVKMFIFLINAYIRVIQKNVNVPNENDANSLKQIRAKARTRRRKRKRRSKKSPSLSSSSSLSMNSMNGGFSGSKKKPNIILLKNNGTFRQCNYKMISFLLSIIFSMIFIDMFTYFIFHNYHSSSTIPSVESSSSSSSLSSSSSSLSSSFFFVHSLPSSINVGAVFTHDRLDQEIAFKLAIKRINSDRIILPHTKLIPKIEHIQKHDSFHADKKVCGLLKTGVVAIFDPLDGYISRHLQSICDALDIPHLETRWDFTTKRDDLSVNLYPKPNVLARAYVDIVKAWAWDQFAIVYEDNEGLIRLQDFFKEAESLNWRIKLHQFKPGKPYRETFWKIKNDGERNIILDVKNENIFRALKHAQQVGLITESHSYLITQLDLHTIDLEDFKFGKTKITAFKIIDDSNDELKLLREDWRTEFPKFYTPEISTESALIYDAVKLLATAIRELDHGQSIEIQQVSCESSVPWSHGSSLINYMRPIEFRGITGLVGFNDLGFRSSITLSVVTVSPNGLEEIGTWSEDAAPEQRLNISRDWTIHYSSSALENKTLIITTILNDPYTMIKDSSFKRIGNDQFEGYAIDLISELSKLLHFNYEFRLVKDGAYGRPDKDSNWNGMMGELIRGEADLAVADLTITSKREDAVDFTHPFMNTGISILYKKPTKKVTSLFSFLSPFSNIVWIYVVCAYVGVSSMLFIVGRLSPYEWENPHPCRQNEQVLENAFSLSNSFWFTIGSLMQQASDLTPKAMSTRTIASIWYFFTLIMIASYTANLAAFLTVEKIVYPIENAEGLAAQDKIKYGCLGSGSTASFFAESNITTYKKMWDFMDKHKEVFMKSNEEGRKTVEKADGMYAYLMESASIEYIIERNCNLTQIGGLLDSKGYGIATRKDSPYRTPLSQAILKLQESGALLTLKERWWKQKKGGGQCIDDPKKSSGSVTPLKIDNVGGVFVVLLGGLSFSLFVVILEFVWKSRYEQNDQNETICEEMMNDLKFALMCQSSSKILPSSKQNNLQSTSTTSSHHHLQYNSSPLHGGHHHYNNNILQSILPTPPSIHLSNSNKQQQQQQQSQQLVLLPKVSSSIDHHHHHQHHHHHHHQRHQMQQPSLKMFIMAAEQKQNQSSQFHGPYDDDEEGEDFGTHRINTNRRHVHSSSTTATPILKQKLVTSNVGPQRNCPFQSDDDEPMISNYKQHSTQQKSSASNKTGSRVTLYHSDDCAFNQSLIDVTMDGAHAQQTQQKSNTWKRSSSKSTQSTQLVQQLLTGPMLGNQLAKSLSRPPRPGLDSIAHQQQQQRFQTMDKGTNSGSCSNLPTIQIDDATTTTTTTTNANTPVATPKQLNISTQRLAVTSGSGRHPATTPTTPTGTTTTTLKRYNSPSVIPALILD